MKRHRERKIYRVSSSAQRARSQPSHLLFSVLFPFRAAAHNPPPPIQFPRYPTLPRRRSQSDYRGVRARPNDTFTAEIRSTDERVSLSTYDMVVEAARAYAASAWRLGHPRDQMNFGNCQNAR